MEFKKSIFVKSADEFPNWKAPCPKCGGENCISTRRDKTGAWCKKCGQNWQITKYGSASNSSPEAQNGTSNESSGLGWNIIADELKNLRDADLELNQRIDKCAEYIKILMDWKNSK